MKSVKLNLIFERNGQQFFELSMNIFKDGSKNYGK